MLVSVCDWKFEENCGMAPRIVQFAPTAALLDPEFPACAHDAASVLRSHSLSPEAWEDVHGGVPSPSSKLRSHSLELPSSSPDEEDMYMASHCIHLDDSFASCADLASLGDDVATDPDDNSAASGWRSPSGARHGATFHDALDVQVRIIASAVLQKSGLMESWFARIIVKSYFEWTEQSGTRRKRGYFPQCRTGSESQNTCQMCLSWYCGAQMIVPLADLTHSRSLLDIVEQQVHCDAC